MKRLIIFSFALVAMCITSSAATYCDALITSTQAVHTAHITCSSLGGNQYQFVFESTDAFVKYNDGSNFFMNVNGAGGFHVSKNLTQNGNTLSVIIESNVAPTIYAGDFFVQYEDGEAWFKLPIDADFSQVCDGSDTPDTPDTPDTSDTPDTPDTPGDLQTGSCSGTSTGVDPFYTNANPQHAVQSLEKGFNWTAETTTTGVNITVQFLDNLPGMASPYLFTFDAQGILLGDPIKMSGWDNATRTATHTLTGLANGQDLVFLVQVALEAGKILFTERILYTVGDNCDDTGDNEGSTVVGSCTNTSTGVDEYYTSNNAAASGSDVFTNGYTWTVSTMSSGEVEIEVEFHDFLPGMAAPWIFFFKDVDGNEQLDGDPLPMRWLGMTARYTLTGKAIGDEISFLVQVPYELHVVFSERIRYVVGENCQETALEQPAVQTKPRKVIENGQIYIIHNGIRYNALGTQIK